MSWIYWLIAGRFEIAWAIGLKYTYEFTRVWPSVNACGARIKPVSA